MEPLVYETHMHTTLCKHAVGAVDDYAETAQNRNLRGITVTCHAPLPGGVSAEVRMSDSQWPEYVEMVELARRRWEGKVEVLLGLESEYLPGYESWVESLHQREKLNYVLGSVHCHIDLYLERFDTGSPLELQQKYFAHLAEAAESGLYDCISHPDLVKNLYPDDWKVSDVMDDIKDALDRIAETGVAMELNTSGLHKKIQEMNPGIEILTEIADRDIPVVVGADAHHPARVADKFELAMRVLREVGCSHVSYFRERERIELAIEDALASLRDPKEGPNY